MRLNTIVSAPGSRKTKTRVGRGIGSGVGKTCRRGHKGQKSRAGGKVRIGFEGGQMPLQMRLPKFGFTSRKSSVSAIVRLHELDKVGADVIDIAALQAANVVGRDIKFVKVIASGEVKSSVILRGIPVTSGAKKAIEAAGGKVEE